MARPKGSKNKKKKNSDPGLLSEVREETIRSVVAVALFSLAIFFILVAVSGAGPVGHAVFDGLTTLLGVGYYLIPVFLLTLAYLFFRSSEYKVRLLKIISSAVVFVCALSLIGILGVGQGGIIGASLADLMVSLFDIYASVLILTMIISVASLVLFNASLVWLSDHLHALMGKKEGEEGAAVAVKEEKEPSLVSYGDDEEDGDEEEAAPPPDLGADDEEDEAPAPPPREPIITTGMNDTSGQHAHAALFRMPTSSYNPPPLTLLEKDKGKPSVGDTKANANIIKRTLQNFGIEVEMDEISVGPTVTRYAMKPAEGVRISKIVSLQNNLELALAAHPIRIEAPIPGKSLVGIEVPNTAKATIGLATILGHDDFVRSEKPLLVALGRDIAGAPLYADLAKMPHLLIAGATGSGKSVTIHDLVVSLLYRNGPEHLRFMMIDPKRVELTAYNKIPQLLTPVITDAKKAILALQWAAREMERRYDLLEAEHVRDISSYHRNILGANADNLDDDDEKGDESKMPEAMPYIVIIIDELADIMQAYPRELEAAIVRLAQMSRAVGIHLMLSTQRPSVNVITGLIKANVPARLALQVASQIDSRTILDGSGAEKLLGAGDTLYLSGDMPKPRRVQAPFITEQEVKMVVKYISKNNESLGPMLELGVGTDGDKGNPIFSGESSAVEDDLYENAREAVIKAEKASTSYLQRKLSIGYGRAAKLLDLLEERGVVGPAKGSKPREILDKFSGEREAAADAILEAAGEDSN